jgi:hypothetical protein
MAVVGFVYTGGQDEGVDRRVEVVGDDMAGFDDERANALSHIGWGLGPHASRGRRAMVYVYAMREAPE